MAHRRESQQGSALVMVLVLLTILSIALAAMFGNAGANLVTSAVVADQNHKVYATDGGVERVIQSLRNDSTECGASSPPLADVTIDGRTVALSCQTSGGMVTSVSPWALVTMDAGPSSLSSQSGGAATIVGSVFATGTATFGAPMTVTTALYQSASACPTGALAPGSGRWQCTAAATPDPVPALPPPSFEFVSRGPDAAFTVDDPMRGPCSVFLPGRYTGRPNLGSHNYFASGVYYFVDSTLNRLPGELFGGRPGPDDSGPVVTTSSACASDREAGIDDGTGVEIILGGSSTIDIGPNDVELYSRIPGGKSEGAAGISIRTVPNPPPTGYVASTVGPGTSSPVLTMPPGGAAHLAVHGMLYAPNASVNLTATNGTKPVLLGGLECFDLNIETSASGSSGLISAQAGGQDRYVAITASTDFGTPRAVVSRAVVDIKNDAARTVVVQSWITTRP